MIGWKAAAVWATLMVVCGARFADAQSSPERFRVSGTIGDAIPRAGSGLTSGLMVTGGFAVKATLPVNVVIEGGTAALDPSARGYDAALRVFFGRVDLEYVFNLGRWRPYVIGGVGFYRFGLHPGPVSHGPGEGHDQTLAPDVGAGLEFQPHRVFGVSAEIRYQHINDITAIVPFRGAFTTAAVGVRAHF